MVVTCRSLVKSVLSLAASAPVWCFINSTGLGAGCNQKHERQEAACPPAGYAWFRQHVGPESSDGHVLGCFVGYTQHVRCSKVQLT